MRLNKNLMKFNKILILMLIFVVVGLNIVYAADLFDATGGTITYVGDDKVHTFTSGGTFTVTGSGTVEVLVVAAGGGGGWSSGSGGGGAGGLQYSASQAVTSQTYAITIGAGGAGATESTHKGANGSNSSFAAVLVATGGGGGGSGVVAQGVDDGAVGGSGGGGTYTGTGADGIAGQGFAGGDGVFDGGYNGGGGGGASEVGEAGGTTQYCGGDGGDGISKDISGVATYYAGGGGGSGQQATGAGGIGGNGGGGNGALHGVYNATNGIANTGGGGGGGGATTYIAGDGGSGIVIIRYTPVLGSSDGESCTVDSDCLSDNCDLDIAGVTKYCHATVTSCTDYNLGNPWERANTYSTCYDNDDYTCSNSIWQSADCGTDTSCSYYLDLAAVCSAASCVSCPTSCSVDGECDANAHCNGTCKADFLGSNLDTGLNINLTVSDTEQENPSGTHLVEFEDTSDNAVFISFTNDFSTNPLSAPDIIVSRSTTERGSVLVEGLSGISKTINVPKVIGIDMVCVKNASGITSVGEITEGCNAIDEILFDNCGSGSQTIGGITCTDKNGYYEVTGLMNSAVAEYGNVRLEIWSEGTYWQLDDIFFYANYTNSSSGAAITGADCNIWFDDTGWDDMTFDGTLHNYNRTFNSAGDKTYNVSCTHSDYTNLTVQDSFTISQSAIPEFSLITLGLGLVAVLIGLAIIRKKR